MLLRSKAEANFSFKDSSSRDAVSLELAIAVSVDSLFTLDKFKNEQGYNFTLLSDWNKDVSRSYGSFYEDFVLDMKGVSKRSAFVINKDGVIKYAEVLESAGDIPNFSKVKETLKSLN